MKTLVISLLRLRIVNLKLVDYVILSSTVATLLGEKHCGCIHCFSSPIFIKYRTTVLIANTSNTQECSCSYSHPIPYIYVPICPSVPLIISSHSISPSTSHSSIPQTSPTLNPTGKGSPLSTKTCLYPVIHALPLTLGRIAS